MSGHCILFKNRKDVHRLIGDSIELGRTRGFCVFRICVYVRRNSLCKPYTGCFPLALQNKLQSQKPLELNYTIELVAILVETVQPLECHCQDSSIPRLGLVRRRSYPAVTQNRVICSLSKIYWMCFFRVCASIDSHTLYVPLDI